VEDGPINEQGEVRLCGRGKGRGQGRPALASAALACHNLHRPGKNIMQSHIRFYKPVGGQLLPAAGSLASSGVQSD